MGIYHLFIAVLVGTFLVLVCVLGLFAAYFLGLMLVSLWRGEDILPDWRYVPTEEEHWRDVKFTRIGMVTIAASIFVVSAFIYIKGWA